MKNTFDDLYLYFSASYLTHERTQKECDLIEQLCRLKKGDHILDIGCGHGRIANELARRGYQVTGIDWSQSALDLAARNARADKLDVRYENKNFLEAVWTDTFDCALSWYTSFGYTDDETSNSQLREIYASLKKGGRLLIDHINRDRCLKTLPASSIQEKDDNFMIDHFNYDTENDRLQIRRRFIKNGVVTEAPYSIRLLPYSEIKGWMRQAGFNNIEGYNIQGQPYRIDGERMILTGVK